MREKISIAVFTRTSWNEMPRIRHQITDLLTANGHNVTFFQKAESGTSLSPEKISEHLTVVSLPELIHHQLRPLRQIGAAANLFPKKFIRKYYSENQLPDVVINFNYDFGFLKEIFPSIPLITIINDDFIAQAKPWMKKMITARIAETSSASDAVLTVSYPLQKVLSKYNSNTMLFFPWADKNYSSPVDDKVRNVVLYFGYINHRIDFTILNKIAENKISLRMIGPVQRTVDKTAWQKLLTYESVSLLSARLLNEVDLSDVFCSIMPYDLNVESVNACSISNRSYNLLSYGIPLLQPALPEALPAPENVVRYCNTNEDYFSGIEYFRKHFFDSQNEIQKFLSGNYSADRYKILNTFFDELIAKYKPVETINTGY